MSEAAPGSSRHELSAQQTAEDIYNRLQEQQGIASLSGPNSGEAIYHADALRIKVVRLDGSLSSEQEAFRKRGFTDEDIASGLTAIIEHQFRNPHWPKEPLQYEPEIRYLNVSDTGRVVTGGYNTLYHPAMLNRFDVDAIKRVADLCRIPGQIITIFGSYDKFWDVLNVRDRRDMAGIDYPKDGPYPRILYRDVTHAHINNLSTFVRAQQELLAFYQGSQDTGPGSPFDKLLGTLEQLQRQGRVSDQPPPFDVTEISK